MTQKSMIVHNSGCATGLQWSLQPPESLYAGGLASKKEGLLHVLADGSVQCTDRWECPHYKQVGGATVLTGGRGYCTNRWEGPLY